MPNVSFNKENTSQVNLTDVNIAIPGEPTSEPDEKTIKHYSPFAATLWALVLYVTTQIIAVAVILLGLRALGWSGKRTELWLQSAVSAQFLYILLAETMTIIAILALLRHRQLPMRLFGWIKPKLIDIWTALTGFGVYVLGYILVVAVVSSLIPSLDVDQEQQIGFGTAHSPTDLLLVFASLVILPPLTEEIVFRGFLFTSLRARNTFAASTLLTSLLFGVAHLQFGSGEPLLWIAAIDTFVLSLVLCSVREKSGSLWPAIFIHMFKNMVAFLFLFLLK
ncbi:CPBP family intramembrane metalloprotease [Candidatus Saccharibacteria bacterium]|nr:MAG: CPBP family intramembrane metalloprotease [Candidatus Saccharibacteria bacterium]